MTVFVRQDLEPLTVDKQGTMTSVDSRWLGVKCMFVTLEERPPN